MAQPLRGLPAQGRLFEVDEPEDLRLQRARAVTYHVLRAYWVRAVRRDDLPLRSPGDFGVTLEPRALTPEDLPRIESTSCQVCTLPLLAAAHEIGGLFTSLLPADYRSRLGIYFTPPALADRLLDLGEASGVDFQTARVLDPACGGGAFLAPVIQRKLKRLSRKLPLTILEAIASQVHGFELDPFAAWMSQVFAELAALPLTIKTGRRLPRIVDIRDALEPNPDWESTVDLVVGNPPYGKIRLEEGWRSHYQRSLFGHANLYGLFTDQALRLIGLRGVVAFVTPTSFLGGEYFKNLRALLLREAPPSRIEFVADREGVFAEVLQETLLATFQRAARRSSVQVALLQVESERIREVQPCGKHALPAGPGVPWLLPRSPEQAALIARAGRSPFRLASYGYGVSTGPLVWNRHRDQLSSRPGPDTFPLIWAESVTSDGSFDFRAEKRNHAPYCRLRGEIDRWLVVSSPCVLVQRTTSKEQNRRLIAAPLPTEFLLRHGAVVVENHLNMVYPLDAEPRITLAALAALLNSRIADQLFRCISGSVAVSAYELAALPLPPPDVLSGIDELLRQGAAASAVERAIENGYSDGRHAAAA